MTSVETLLTELSPHGVPHLPLSQVASLVSARAAAGAVDATTYVGVDNLLPNFGGRRDAGHKINLNGSIAYGVGDVLIGNIRPYLKKVWLADRNGGASPDVLVVSIDPTHRGSLMPRFLYFLLASESFIDYSMKHAKGAKMPRGSKTATLDYRVPVPPLEVQREIVRILDHFTDLEAELEAELESELEARRQQYAHFRAELLDPSRMGAVRFSTLGDVSRRVSSGATPTAGRPEYYQDGAIPWLRTQEVRFTDIWDTEMRITDRALKETAAKWIPANCVIVAISGATAARSAVNRIPMTTNQHCCNLEIDPSQANFRYVFYWVRNQYESLKALGQGARSDLNASLIKGFPIAVPPLHEQERIVDVLDKFDALVNDLSIGLPAELAARRKQYEYYRDKLLTLEEAPE